ncbi:Long-chain-fatty-acid--CoA ligase 1, partial [Araneus ventricosus]
MEDCETLAKAKMTKPLLECRFESGGGVDAVVLGDWSAR